MSTTIVTVTLNPAIDQTLVVDHMLLGEANRVIESRTDPGGKGINVARVLRELGAGSVATGFAPGGMGRFIEHELERLGIIVDFVHTRGETRTNLTLIDARLRTTTTIHAQGPLTDSRYVEMFRARVRKYLRPGTWLVVAGSIPPAPPAHALPEPDRRGQRRRRRHRARRRGGEPALWRRGPADLPAREPLRI